MVIYRIYDIVNGKSYIGLTSQETNIEYMSIAEAGRQLKIPGANISKVLKGERQKAHNLSFKYKQICL